MPIYRLVTWQLAGYPLACTRPLESPAILICPESVTFNIVLAKRAPKWLKFKALFFRTMWCPADSGQMRIAGDSREAVHVQWVLE